MPWRPKPYGQRRAVPMATPEIGAQTPTSLILQAAARAARGTGGEAHWPPRRLQLCTAGMADAQQAQQAQQA